MKFMKKKILAILLAAVMIIPAVAGCGCVGNTNEEDGAVAGKTTKVVLNEVAHSLFYAPMYVAIEKGYFKEQGIDLERVTGFGADKTMTAVLSGEADIGFMGPETTVYACNEGATDLVVNFAQLTQRAGNFLVSRTNEKNFDWNSLRGKSVLGGRPGGMPEMILEYILKQKGIDPNEEVEIVQNIDFGLTSGAFSGGQADYTVEFEPGATALEDEGVGYVVASMGVESGYVPYTAYSAKKSYIEKNPDIIKKFKKAIERGLEYVATHSSKDIAKVIAPQFAETDVDTICKIVDRYKSQDTWKRTTEFTEEAFDLLQDILISSGELKEKVPYSDLVQN